MKPWPESGSKAQVCHMNGGDFFESEKSTTMDRACTVNIEFTGKDGQGKTLKKGIELQDGEVIDASVMNVNSLRKFYLPMRTK